MNNYIVKVESAYFTLGVVTYNIKATCFSFTDLGVVFYSSDSKTAYFPKVLSVQESLSAIDDDDIVSD